MATASPQPILTIVAHYPKRWERAGNGPYFIPGSGQVVDVAAVNGVAHKDHTGDPAVTARWPALYIEGKVIVAASFAAVDLARAKASAAAMSAGPMLVSCGGILDIPSRIAARRAGIPALAQATASLSARSASPPPARRLTASGSPRGIRDRGSARRSERRCGD